MSRAAAFALACRVAANGDLDGIPVALMEAMAAVEPGFVEESRKNQATD